jgi:hypothetical protein
MFISAVFQFSNGLVLEELCEETKVHSLLKPYTALAERVGLSYSKQREYCML